MRVVPMVVMWVCVAGVVRSSGEGNLDIRGENYPRVFFFRQSEGAPSNPSTTYEKWADDFDDLMGIMGKCLDEEVLGREARNPEFFNRFKREHPNQVVLLHFNGNSRDPRHGTEKYFPGHWTYRRAVKILGDVPAAEGASEIRVEDASDFKVNSGRYRTSNDDIALFGITPDGRHDWNHCEQVRLLSIDARANTIRVQRGCYGTKPLAFPAGKSRAVAHAVEGPWGAKNNLLWFYNFTTHCPKDAEGKTCADRLVDDLGTWFSKGGKLADFDGLEFDVFFNVTNGDTDGDGVDDDGVIDGFNAYGAGTVEFARKLRERLGENRVIQGDGALGPGGQRSQRAFGILNGIESEGFPNLNDWDFNDWSGGLNRHAFWRENGRAPAFSYINHKWNEAVPGKPGEHANPKVPFSRHRLSFAAAQFTDAALCSAFTPPGGGRGRTDIWDEFICGTEKTLGWLGKPEGPAVRMAAQTPDLLKGLGTPAGKELVGKLRGRVDASVGKGGVTIVPAGRDSTGIEFTLPGIPTKGKDLVVLLTMKGEPMKGYPPEMARYVTCRLAGGMTNLMAREPEGRGMILRGGREGPIDKTTGAQLAYRENVSIGGQAHPIYMIHPPYKEARGAVFWTADVDVPVDTELRFSLGMSEKAPGKSDGVWFSVEAAELAGDKTGSFNKIFEKTTKAHEWIPCVVPLKEWGGKRVRLKFIADCGPKDNATTDQGYWAQVRLMGAGLRDDEITPASDHMTWLNNNTFTSAYYFHQVSSRTVDFTVSVEGAEPVTVEALTVHAHPDAMCRVFEKGLVIANPSRKDYTFNLEKLTPGRAYRRLQATPAQDTAANNGQPAGKTVTLGDRDALFLRREP